MYAQNTLISVAHTLHLFASQCISHTLHVLSHIVRRDGVLVHGLSTWDHNGGSGLEGG